MIRFAEVEEQVRLNGVPHQTIEKDYCLTWLLHGLAAVGFFREVAFYGGTAIKKVFFDDARYSEDLDFLSDKGISRDHVPRFFEQAFPVLRDEANIGFSVIRDEQKDDRLQFFLSYDGFAELSGVKELKVDLLGGLSSLPSMNSKEILPSYSDLEGHSSELRACTLEAIIADKIWMINDPSRTEPRDVYDFWFTLMVKEFDFSKVFREFQHRFGYKVPVQAVCNSIKDEKYQRLWEIRLKDQVREAPDFKRVIEELEEELGSNEST